LIPEKGIDDVLSAVEMLKASGVSADRMHLTVVGEAGPGGEEYAACLRARGRQLGGMVEFVGHRDDVWPYLFDCDVLIAATRIPEPFGQAVAQGMAAGCVPVVSSHGGHLEQVVAGVTGLTFRPSDPCDLAARLEEILRGDFDLKELGLSGRRSVLGSTDAVRSRELEAALEAIWTDVSASGESLK
jgi:glycosyltransferase involved in cell wall biosynthesis